MLLLGLSSCRLETEYNDMKEQAKRSNAQTGECVLAYEKMNYLYEIEKQKNKSLAESLQVSMSDTDSCLAMIKVYHNRYFELRKQVQELGYTFGKSKNK